MCKWFKKLFSPKDKETTRKNAKYSFNIEVYEYQKRKGITAHELQRWLVFFTIEQVKDAIDIFNNCVETRINTGDADYSMLTDKPILKLKSGTEVKKVFAKDPNKITIKEDTYFIVYEDLIPLLYGLLSYSYGILKFKRRGKEEVQLINITSILMDVLGSLEDPNYQTRIITKIQ